MSKKYEIVRELKAAGFSLERLATVSDFRDLNDLSLTLQEIWDILDQDWLYDLLPGDGQDDYILEQLRWHFMAKSLEAK
jgi:hypothetical protein